MGTYNRKIHIRPALCMVSSSCPHSCLASQLPYRSGLRSLGGILAESYLRNLVFQTDAFGRYCMPTGGQQQGYLGGHRRISRALLNADSAGLVAGRGRQGARGGCKRRYYRHDSVSLHAQDSVNGRYSRRRCRG